MLSGSTGCNYWQRGGPRKPQGENMAVRPSAPSVSALRARYEQRVERLTALRHVRSELVSVAGLIGKPVLNQSGQQIGQVADVVGHTAIRSEVVGRNQPDFHEALTASSPRSGAGRATARDGAG